MPTASQTSPNGAHVAAASRAYMIEGVPPTSETEVMVDGASFVITPQKPFVAYLYGLAVTQDLTLVLYGRLKVTGPDAAGDQQTVTGAWVALKTEIFTVAGGADFREVKLSDKIGAPNEFYYAWSAPATGGATTQAGVSFS